MAIDNSRITFGDGTSPSGAATVKNPKSQMKTEDFIRMMVTQLQNQDPLEPAKNEQLLAQMSQIGQLQSQESLTSTLKDLVLQNNLGSAGNLIGKYVKGVDENTGDDATGKVKSVKVIKGEVMLELDGGETMKMAKVSEILDGGTPSKGTKPVTTTDSSTAGTLLPPWNNSGKQVPGHLVS
jgi:flagellar basal-body rod modification protein FlgD